MMSSFLSFLRSRPFSICYSNISVSVHRRNKKCFTGQFLSSSLININEPTITYTLDRFSVPHDRLFLDALERDLKREKIGQEPTTVVTGEPALSFTYDPKRSLYDQFSKASGAVDGEGELEAVVRRADEAQSAEEGKGAAGAAGEGGEEKDKEDGMDVEGEGEGDESGSEEVGSRKKRKTGKTGKASTATATTATTKSALHGPNSPFFSMFSLFEGSPTYKQRRKKVPKHRTSPSLLGMAGYSGGEEDYFGVVSAASAVSSSSSSSGAPAGMSGMAAAAGVNAHMRAREPQTDRYGRDTTRLSAAEMFLAQARGDFGPQSNPDLIASQKERQRRAMLARAGQLADKGYFVAGGGGVNGVVNGGVVNGGAALRASPESVYAGQMAMEQDMVGGPGARPHVEQRHTFPLPGYAVHQDRYAADVAAQWPPSSGAVAAEPMAMAMGMQRTKAFVCPLFSCGRMFKRMEHLKRHLRTHTLERPYQCQHCKKRFSRSDNLNQHLRTHATRDGGGGGASDAENELGDAENEEGEDVDVDEAGLEGYI